MTSLGRIEHCQMTFSEYVLSLRDKGLTYDEIAAHIPTTRGVIAGIVHRHWHRMVNEVSNVTKLEKGYKIVGNKVVKDEAAAEAKLDVSTRQKRRYSKRTRVTTKAKADVVRKSGQ